MAVPRTILPLFPQNGANLLSWVAGADALTATDTACDGAMAEGWDACVHAGELRTVPLPASVVACAGVTVADSLGVFTWVCRESNGTHATSTGFAPGKTLSDLMDFDAGTLRPLSVSAQVNGSTVFTSPSEVLWDNPVSLSPQGGALDMPGQIRLVNGTATRTHSVSADSTALLVKPGVTAVLPANDALFYLTGPIRAFLWLEGAFALSDNNTFSGTGVVEVNPQSFTRVRFATFRNLNVTGTGNVFFNLAGPSTTRFQNIRYLTTTGLGLSVSGLATENPSRFLRVENYEAGALSMNSIADTVLRGVRVYGGTQPSLNSSTYPTVTIQGVYDATDLLAERANVTLGCRDPGHCRVSRLTALDGNRLTIQGNNTTVQDVLVVGSFNEGLFLAGANMRVAGVTVVGSNRGAALQLNNGNGNVHLRDVTLVNGGLSSESFNGGLLSGGGQRHTFINLLLVNNGGVGLDLVRQGSAVLSTFANVVSTDNHRHGLQWASGNQRLRFTGVMRFSNNGSGACEGATGAANTSGLRELAGQLCGNTQTSDAVFTHAMDNEGMDAIFVGATGTPTAYTAITDFRTPSRFQGWVPALGTSTPRTDARRGRCESTGTCVLYDVSTRAGSLPHAINAVGPGALLTHTWDVAVTPCAQIPGAVDNAGVCTSQVPVGLVEAVDSPGNRNAICEPGDVCIATPNAGSYQGHGALGEPVMVPLGTGMVAVRTYATNGF